MKKKYVSPDILIVSLSIRDVLAASTFDHEPEIPTSAGEDNPIDDL